MDLQRSPVQAPAGRGQYAGLACVGPMISHARDSPIHQRRFRPARQFAHLAFWRQKHGNIFARLGFETLSSLVHNHTPTRSCREQDGATRYKMRVLRRPTLVCLAPCRQTFAFAPTAKTARYAVIRLAFFRSSRCCDFSRSTSISAQLDSMDS